MSRTPLMRALQRLAGEHRAATQLGIEVEELPGAARPKRASRGASSSSGRVPSGLRSRSAGRLALARSARAAGASRIAIVGGGIAGLTAALTLQDKGVYCDVYESSSRVGGRMHSDWEEFGTSFWANGQQAELCGELIDSNHKTILQLAQRFRLATVDLLQAQPNGTTDTYWIFGADYPYAQGEPTTSSRSTTRCRAKCRRRATRRSTTTSPRRVSSSTSMTLYDWITNYVPGGHASRMGALLNAAYNEEYGAETTDQSALNLIYLLGYKSGPGTWSIYGASDERYHIVGGNAKLPVAIANALPSGSVHLGYRDDRDRPQLATGRSRSRSTTARRSPPTT